MRLDNRKALITGGTQGVGAAIAKTLAQAGCDLIIHGLQEDEHSLNTQERCRSFDVSVQSVCGDLSGPFPACIDSMLDQIPIDEVDLLVNNAGTFCDKPFLDMDTRTFERTFALNVSAGYFLTQAFARHWIAQSKSGRVLFTGSINGELAEPNHTAYDASKGAVQAMVKSLCVALAPHGVRVNSLAPGLVVTPLTAGALEDKDTMKWMELHTPNGRVPGPDSCGAAALFLLSDEAEHVHGQTILVDGGMSVWQQPDLPSNLRGKLG